MGMDIDAFIVVGRTIDDLREIVSPEAFGVESWGDMEDAAWQHEGPPGDARKIEVYEGASDTGEIFGVVVAKTPSWDSLELDFDKLQRLVDQGKVWFELELGASPKLYLVPRMW